MTGIPIISADERMKEKKGIKGCVIGVSGIGKTSQLWTLDPKSTLFIDLEAGDLAVEGWKGDTFRPRTWQACRDFAVFIGGPNPSLRDDQPYSEAHYNAVCEKYGDPKTLDKYETIFIDSITVSGRLCFQWSKGQPQAYSEKTGKPDMRGAYGLMGQEMVNWLTHLQHARNKNVWVVGILDKKTDDFNRVYYEIQIDGSKTGLELPGIFDQIITMAEIPHQDGSTFRAFINHTMNPYGYPAKDRSGRLELLEEPHLGRLMAKIKGPVKPASERLVYDQPKTEAAPAETNTQSETKTQGESS